MDLLLIVIGVGFLIGGFRLRRREAREASVVLVIGVAAFGLGLFIGVPAFVEGFQRGLAQSRY